MHVDFTDPSQAPKQLGNLYHITNHELFREAISAGTMRWDAKGIAFVQLAETYHIKQSQLYVTLDEGVNLFEIVSKRFKAWNGSEEKVAEKLRLQNVLDNPPDDIMVCVKHSIAAGNCEVGTENFRRKYCLLAKDCYSVAELKEKKVPFDHKMFQRALLEAIKSAI